MACGFAGGIEALSRNVGRGSAGVLRSRTRRRIRPLPNLLEVSRGRIRSGAAGLRLRAGRERLREGKPRCASGAIPSPTTNPNATIAVENQKPVFDLCSFVILGGDSPDRDLCPTRCAQVKNAARVRRGGSRRFRVRGCDWEWWLVPARVSIEWAAAPSRSSGGRPGFHFHNRGSASVPQDRRAISKPAGEPPAAPPLPRLR